MYLCTRKLNCSDYVLSLEEGHDDPCGSSLSHGAVVAREYGLPTIVNVKGATQVLKDGDRIVMDASRGRISRI